ncbi:hypothetical protein BPUM_0853 [Bacillus pumilus SAFR-032]|uniref:Uncharacterized protein n=1 Tax=Bacillus pumilus (strain SAFR-032) TaxID=315750 RepID=A8FBC0_BACP2|nr:hypothetical protein BPUM_0853 [Bacillus pumilus SAFR-032]
MSLFSFFSCHLKYVYTRKSVGKKALPFLKSHSTYDSLLTMKEQYNINIP